MVSLIHPRMLTSLIEFYAETVTIQENTPTIAESGAEVPSWSDVVGLIDLPCSVSPLSPNSPTGMMEYRRLDMTVTHATHHIALQALYPAITTSMRAVVDTVAYNILAIEKDSHDTMTRLKVELVTA